MEPDAGCSVDHLQKSTHTSTVMTTAIQWPEGLTYQDYVALSKEFAKTAKTSGPVQAENLIHFTRLNASRMRRIYKTTPLREELLDYLAVSSRQYIWRVFTETWCGDAAQSLPVLQKVADSAPNVELEIHFRDEHPELFEGYLTNGTKSIPKLVVFDKESGEELGTWGPRPAVLQAMVLANKKEPSKPYEEFAEDIQRWYNDDKGNLIQTEILQALRLWEQV